MKTRVKVKRADLLKIVEGRLRKAENEHRRAVESYPDRLAAWQADAIVRMEKALEAARKGKFPEGRYGSRGITLPEYPMKPSDNGRELCNLRRLHKTLEIGAEETVLLSQEDADQYFGPCKL